MKGLVQGVMYVCPECHKTVMFRAHEDGTFGAGGLLCAADGYSMRPFVLNDFFLESLLKGEKTRD